MDQHLNEMRVSYCSRMKVVYSFLLFFFACYLGRARISRQRWKWWTTWSSRTSRTKWISRLPWCSWQICEYGWFIHDPFSSVFLSTHLSWTNAPCSVCLWQWKRNKMSKTFLVFTEFSSHHKLFITAGWAWTRWRSWRRWKTRWKGI